MKKLSIKIYDKNNRLRRYRTTAERLKIVHLLRLAFDKYSPCRVVMVADYGRHEDVFGKMVRFTNEVVCHNHHDARLAFEAFWDA